MRWYDERRSQQRNPCSAAFTAAQIIEQTIFARITNRTTAEQFQLAQETLSQLCSELAATVTWDHYAASSGPPHSCVRDVYVDAAFRLKNLEITQPPPPPPPQRLITNQGIIVDLAEHLETSTDETDLGTDDSPLAEGNGR
jgi:hypothetical protein